MRLKMADSFYMLLACASGAWQAWCFEYGSDNMLAVILPMFMGFPFAVASYAHASLLSSTDEIAKRPNWKGMLVLWAGMPLSLAGGALALLAKSGVIYVTHLQLNNLPRLDSLRLLIGESGACLLWAKCLLIWSREQGRRHSRRHLLALFAALLVGVLTAHGLSILLLRSFHRDHYFLFTSIAATTISALSLVFLRDHCSGEQQQK